MKKILLTLSLLITINLYSSEFDNKFDNAATKNEKCQLVEEYVQKNNGRAFYILGASYYFGDVDSICDNVRDFDMSFKYLKKSYDAGYIYSASLLSEHYEYGKGTPKNTILAYSTVANGYSKGDSESSMTYAYYKCIGYGTSKNCKLGKNIMRKLISSDNRLTSRRAKNIWKTWKFNDL